MTLQKSREGSFKIEQEENQRKLFIGCGIRNFKKSVRGVVRQKKNAKDKRENKRQKRKKQMLKMNMREARKRNVQGTEGLHDT